MGFCTREFSGHQSRKPGALVRPNADVYGPHRPRLHLSKSSQIEGRLPKPLLSSRFPQKRKTPVQQVPVSNLNRAPEKANRTHKHPAKPQTDPVIFETQTLSAHYFRVEPAFAATDPRELAGGD